jgi:hypothetical protein
MSGYASVLQHKTLYSWMAFWDKEVEKAIADGGDYGRYLSTQHPQRVDADCRAGNVSWLGEPVPSSYQDAMARNQFLNMELYKNAYEQIQPYLEELAKKSEAIIEDPVLKPNDLELGTFSIDRAMMAIDAIPAFYSKKHKRYYYLDDGEEYIDPKTKEVKYRLRSDKSELELSQLEEDGEKMWYTNNKKSFIYKINSERPNRAVRLFILIGANAGSQTYWAGLTGVIIAQFLESKGYTVCITCVTGVNRGGLRKKTGEYVEGHRFNMFNLKNYSDTYDTPAMLYPLADMSFFRVRQFGYFMAEQFRFQDRYNSDLGRMPSIDAFETALYDEQKRKNIESEENTLYYFLGGNEVTNIQGAIRNIERIVLDAEQKNKEALERIRAVQPTKTI